MLANEEDIAITADGATWLSLRAPREMIVLLPDAPQQPDGADEPLAALGALCESLIRDLGLAKPLEPAAAGA